MTKKIISTILVILMLVSIWASVLTITSASAASAQSYSSTWLVNSANQIAIADFKSGLTNITENFIKKGYSDGNDEETRYNPKATTIGDIFMVVGSKITNYNNNVQAGTFITLNGKQLPVSFWLKWKLLDQEMTDADNPEHLNMLKPVIWKTNNTIKFEYYLNVPSYLAFYKKKLSMDAASKLTEKDVKTVLNKLDPKNKEGISIYIAKDTSGKKVIFLKKVISVTIKK